MSTGTVWTYREFIKRELGLEEAIEFEIAVKKYQAEQITYERERIIKLLEEEVRYDFPSIIEMSLDSLKELIKGEPK